MRDKLAANRDRAARGVAPRWALAVLAMCALWLAPALTAHAAAALPSCQQPPSAATMAAGQHLTVKIDPTSVWRPRGGNVRFTVSGPGFTLGSAAVGACFRWSYNAAPANRWLPSPSVRVVDASDPSAPVFTATVPELSDSPRNAWKIIWNMASAGDTTALGLVPLADFRVMIDTGTGAAPVEVVQPVGITNQPLALVVAIAVVAASWIVLYVFARLRGVPGGPDPVLQLISTKSGAASLSQLQILLWSFVIGASAVYVMVLSGNLIDITGGTLVLLGISGAAALGAKLQSVQANRADPAPTSQASPGEIVTLGLSGAPDETDIGLSWGRPGAGAQVTGYLVRCKPDAVGATWTTVTSTLEKPGVRVVGLKAGTRYLFEVSALNGALAGPAATIKATTADTPKGVVGPVDNLRLATNASNTSLEIAWDALQGAAAYCVQWRAHNCADPWKTLQPSPTAGLRAKIVGLNANTAYDVRVAANAKPAAGSLPTYGRWSTLATATVGPRVPLWSDLIVASDGAEEIEVTRVQMLFFTVIVALFVLMRVISSGEIPTIPEGYLLLMGISNGVYLTAKFVN
jgi:hypothetical protein